VELTLARDRRPHIDFVHNAYPIVATKCLPCHDRGGAEPILAATEETSTNEFAGMNAAYTALLSPSREEGSVGRRFVHPGKARTSPLTWHMLGRNTSRSWDPKWQGRPAVNIPTGKGPVLTDGERRLLIKWIDMGATYAFHGMAPAEHSSKQ